MHNLVHGYRTSQLFTLFLWQSFRYKEQKSGISIFTTYTGNTVLRSNNSSALLG